MSAVRVIVSVIYALLILLAVLSKYRESKKLDNLMLIGGLLLLFANFTGHVSSLVFAVISLLTIHVAALLNGKSNGKINVSHHLIRLLVSIVIFILFWLS